MTIDSKPFRCTNCERRYKTEDAMLDHRRDAHDIPKGPAPRIPTDRRPTLAEVEPTCIECGGMGALVTGERVYPHRPDLYAKRFYLCACGAYCGCHPGSVVPLGNPCGPETRRARSAAHDVFDPLWRNGSMARPSAYAWLAEATGILREKCHIGMMTAEQARLVVRVVLQRQRDEAA
jgi:hypothetical protein